MTPDLNREIVKLISFDGDDNAGETKLIELEPGYVYTVIVTKKEVAK